MADVFLPAGTSFVALRDHPELWDRASAWFSGKWELPPEEYHRHRGPGDTRLIGQFLLRDQRVFRDPAKELPFPFCNHKHL